METSLAELQARPKKVPLLKPRGSGMIEKAIVVGGGLAIVYTTAAAAPIAAAAALAAMGLYFWEETNNFQSKDKAAELEAILTASTPKHPSIDSIKRQLKAQYGAEKINAAIESMLGYTEMVHFRSTDNHELAKFGSVYCWVNPDDCRDVKLPLQRMEELFRLWGIIPTVEAQSSPVETTEIVSGALPVALPAALPVEDSPVPSQDALIDRLTAECPELLRLVKAPPIRCVGAQRTGKTTLAKKLALLRLILLPGHSVVACAPHIEAIDSYPSQFKRVGITNGKRDYPAIAAEWEALRQQVYNCQNRSVTHIWDEFGSYSDAMPEETLSDGLTSTLREATKHGSHPVFILHGETLAFMPGGKGLSQVILRGTVRVEAIGEALPPFGEMRPTGRFTVHWLDGSRSEGQIPDWLTEGFLLNLLTGNAAIEPPKVEQPTVLQEEQTQLQPESTLIEHVENLNKAIEEEPHIASENEASSIDPVVQRVGMKIAEKLAEAKGDWINSRDLVKSCFRDLTDREVAKAIIQKGIDTNRLELDERENQNNTVSRFIRLKTTV